MNPLKNNTEHKDTGIVSIDLADYLQENEWVEFDFSPFLIEGLMVKEKEFKAHVAAFDWNQFKDKKVAVYCSTDAILPSWIFMFLACALTGIAKQVTYGRIHENAINDWENQLQKRSFNEYKDKKVVIIARPGIPAAIYIQISQRLKPIVKTLMYGEVGLPKVIWKRK